MCSNKPRLQTKTEDVGLRKQGSASSEYTWMAAVHRTRVDRAWTVWSRREVTRNERTDTSANKSHHSEIRSSVFFQTSGTIEDKIRQNTHTQ